MADNYLDVFNFILIVGVIQGFIFSIATFLSNRSYDKAILFLNLTILFLSINNLQAWLIDKDMMLSFYYLKYLKVPWNIFLAPMFYLFLVYYLRIEVHLKKLFLFGIILFVLSVITRIILLYYLTPYAGTSHFEFIQRRYDSIEDIFIFIFTISIFSYSGLIFFKRKNRFKLISSFDNLKWIKTFFILSSAVLSFWLIALFLNYYFISVHTSYFYAPLRIGTSFLIYWIGYQGLYQQKIVKDRMVLRTQLTNQAPIDVITSYRPARVDTNSNYNKHKVFFGEIDKFIMSKKKFTDPAISLESLALDLKISTSLLSQIINNYSNNNFTDYINKYRVNQVKELLIDRDYKNYTILAIGLESGFNSKSTFYTAFKKFTNLTPAAYKKELIQQKLVRNHGV